MRDVALRRQRLEPDRRRVAAPATPRRTPVEQLRARGSEQNDRNARIPYHALEQVQQVVLRPVNVLDELYGGALPCQLFDELDDGQVQALASLERVEPRGGVDS